MYIFLNLERLKPVRLVRFGTEILNRWAVWWEIGKKELIPARPGSKKERGGGSYRAKVP